jgi:hypothetical protein
MLMTKIIQGEHAGGAKAANDGATVVEAPEADMFAQAGIAAE